MKNSQISLCMVVKNEEEYLPYCLKGVSSIVDEIVIVDTGSTDNTVKVAKKYGAKIINYKMDSLTDLSKARNVSLRMTNNNWILVLDPDESIAQKDLPRLTDLIRNNQVVGYSLVQRNYANNFGLLQGWQKCTGEYPTEETRSGFVGWIPTSLVRLFRNKEGVLWKNGWLASPKQSLQKIGRILESSIPIHHFQLLKGENFIKKKQLAYLRSGLKYEREYLKTSNNYFSIACVLLSYKKNYEKAIKYLKKAISINSLFLKSYPLLGMAYRLERKPEKAINLLLGVIKSGLKNADIFVVLGMSYADLEMYEKGIKSLKKALEINSFHPLANNSLGVIYTQQGLYVNAIKEYQRAAKVHPFHPEAYYNMGVTYQKMGNHKLAEKAYKKALEVNPEDKDVKYNLKAVIN